jgi:GTP cyclohydrolase I
MGYKSKYFQRQTQQAASPSAGQGYQYQSKYFGGPGNDFRKEPLTIYEEAAQDLKDRLERTEYHDNQQRASDRARNRELAEEQKQWYEKYYNLDVDTATASQRAAEARQKSTRDEIYRLTQQANLYFSNNMEKERAEILKQLEYLEGLDAENSASLQQLRQDIATAKRLQGQQKYAQVQEEANASAAKPGAAVSWSMEDIDKQIRELDNQLQILTASNMNEEADALKVELDNLYKLRSMSKYAQDEERTTYSYLKARDAETGGSEAREYLDFMQDTMNYRKGMEQVSDIRSIDNDVLRTLAIGAHSVGTGMANAGAGYNQLLSKDTVPTTAMQYASQELMDGMGAVGQTLYSAGTTVGNMLPSILLSIGLGAAGVSGAVASGAASAAMGASVAGNTYTQAVKEGYDPDKAKTYAALVGASEGVLQYVLGGIGKLGGVTDDVILAKVKTIDNALARMALTGAVKIGSEITEEELQLFLEPAIKSIVFDEGYDAPKWEEIIETAVVTALSTGALESASIIGAGFDNSQVRSAAADLLTEKAKPTETAKAEDPAKAPEAAQEAQKTQPGNVTAPEANVAQAEAPAAMAAETVQQETVQRAQAQTVMNRAAQAFGETGQKAFQTLNDSSMDPLDLYGGFAVYHQAGMTGRDINSVTSQYAKNFPENYRQIAYDAGVADAAASVKARTEAAATATVYGDEAGVIANDYSKSMNQDVVRQLDGVAKSIGRKIVVEDLGDSNGYLDSNGVIHLDIHAENPHLVVAAHEITHVMEDMAPAEHKRYRDYVLNKLAETNGGSILELVEAQKEAYAGKQALSDEQAMNELVADYTKRMMESKDLFSDFAKKDRTAAQKLVDAVKKFLDKVKSVFKGNRQAQNEAAQREFGMDISMVEEAAKLWQEALTATQAQAQTLPENKNTAQQDGGNVRFSQKTVNGNLIAWIENSGLSAKQLQDHKAVAAYIANHIGEVYTIIESGQKVYIGKDLPAEYTQSKYTSYLNARDPKTLKAKNKAASGLGDMIEIATNRRWEKTQHTHSKDAKYGMYRYDSSFAFPVKDRSGNVTNVYAYDVELLIRNASDGKKYLYDIVNIKNDTASALDLLNRETRKGGYTAAAQGSANKSVAQGAGKSNQRFSLKTPVEQTKTLVALHNMDEEKLRRTLKLGSWPAPSVAIVKADQGHENFGEYSAVFPRSTIDPEADYRNKVYGSDAWTPTHNNAQVEYEVNYDAKRAFEDKIESLSSKFAGGAFRNGSVIGSTGVDNETSLSLDEIARKLSKYPAVQAAYLQDRGDTLEPVYKKKNFDSFGNEALQSYIDSIGYQELARLDMELTLGNELPADILEAAKDIIMDEWVSKNEWRLKNKPELREKRIENQRKKLEDWRVRNFIQHAWEYYEEYGATTDEIDTSATASAMFDMILPDGAWDEVEKVVQDWVRPQLEGVLGEPGIYNGRDRLTNSGRRSFRETHYPYSAENIVRAMFNQGSARGEGLWGANANGMLSVATPEYDSVTEIHADEKRLRTLSEDEYDAAVRRLDSEIGGFIANSMEAMEAHSSNRYEEGDIIGSVLLQAAGSRTVKDVQRVFKREGYDLPSDLAKDALRIFRMAAKTPTKYFEAKPQRVVGFEEALAVVAPTDAPADLLDAMRDAGMNVLTYEAGNDGDRLAKVNSVEGSRFSRKGGSALDAALDSQGNQLSDGQKKFFNNSKVRNTNGQLLVMYHGTPNGGFTKFRSGTYFTQDPAYADVYQSPGASSISVKRGADNPQTYQVYLNIQKPFDTRNPKERRIFMNEYYRKYGTGAPLADSGLPDWTDGMDLQEFIEEMEYDYDGLILDEGGTGGYGEEVQSRGLSYVVFSPEQVKNVDNLNPTSDPDIRYSRKGGSVVDTAAARADDVEALKRQVEHWKSQVKQTKGFKVNSKDVEDLAKKLVRAYQADTDAKALTQKLQELYDGIATGYYGNKEIDFETAKARSEEIAKTIVENAVETENEMYVEYAELRKYLRGTTLNISAEDSQDIPDFNDFRKRNFGRMRIGSNGTNIDTVYKELSTLWPEFFNEERETAPSDQLLQIAEVLEAVYRTQDVNPFGRYAEEAVSDIADEVLTYFFTLPQAQTFADKAAAKLKQSTADARLAGQMSQGRQDAKQLRKANDQIDLLKVQLKQAKADAAKLKQTAAKDAPKLEKASEKVAMLEAKLKQATADARLAGQMAQGRRDAAVLRSTEERAARAQERAKAALAQEKQRGAAAVKNLKDKQAAKTAKTREQRKAAELRGKIIRHSMELGRKLERPTDKKHVPDELQSAVAAVLNAINLESNRDSEDHVTKRTKAFQQLREAYKKLAGEVVIDPAVISGDGDQAAAGPLLQAVLDMGDIRIADMNSAQLDTVWRVLKAVEQSVSKANKLFLSAKYETISEMADRLETHSVFRKPKKAIKAPKFLGGSGNLTLDLEIPLTFFSQYGDVGEAIYQELRDAQDYQERLTDQLADEVGEIVKPKQVQQLQKEVHTLHTEEGIELKLTTAHIMELYELSKRKQAEDHLLKGGIVQPEIESAKVDRGTDMIKLTANDLGEIISKLTPEQKQIADSLQKLLTTTLADAGNRASMQAYGYKKFTGTDYWPIKSAQEALHSKVEKNANNTRSIKNIGLAQQVVPHANTALNLNGIFQTFAGHATDMIDYASWLCPMEDANRLFNYKYKDAMGIPTGKTVKGLLDRVGGSGSQAYWSNLMEDIQNGIGGPGDSAFAGIAARITGNVKGASVGANIRVVAQQPTAIFRAATVLSPANLSKGLAKGVTKGNGWQKALEYSDIAKRKDRGGFEISNPMQMSEILYDDKSGLARFNDAMSWAAAKADSVTWGKIWNACEWQVHGQNKALVPGSEAFYQQTAKLFADVINQSQVVDGVMQRSQIMRSSNQISKQMTSFMGEPTMSLNMLMRAYDAIRYEKDPPKRGKAMKQAARVAGALLVTDVMTALAQSLIDGLRDDDRDKGYWQRVWSALTGVTGEEESAWDKAVGVVLSGNLVSTMNPIGRLPYAKDLLSLIQGYSVERMDISAFSDLIEAGTTFVDSVNGEGTKTWAYATKQLATAGSKVLGISAANILRDVWSIARSIAIETGNIPLQYEMEKAIYKIGNEKNDSRYIDLLYDAMNSNEEDYRMIYQDMIRNGMSVEKITKGIEKRMKEDQGVTSVTDLTSRYLTPDQETAYDKAFDRVAGTKVWKSATEEQRGKLEGNLYDLTVGNDAGEDLREKIESGKSVGIDEVDYVLYKLAQEVASKDGNNNTSQAEAEAAAKMLTDLSRAERAWLWQSTNKGWKTESNPFK